jgi:hypothetical protein
MRIVAGFVAAAGAALLLLAVLQDALQMLYPDHTRMLSLALGASGLIFLCAGIRAGSVTGLGISGQSRDCR